MALNVGEVQATAGLNAKGFMTGIDAVYKEGIRVSDSIARRFDQLGDSLMQTGRTLTTRVTAPLIASAGLMIRSFDKQAQAEAQVRQGIISTGSAAGRTERQLFAMANQLQEISRFGDEDILQGVTAQILTFTNIAGEEFDRTQKAALDLASRLGGDLQSSAIMLGKALNDPVSNLGALGRAGIQFSAQQTEVIKQLAETGRVAEAQRIILSELEKQYGGSAEAAAKAGAGGIKQLWNSIGDLGEEFGKVIMDYLNPFIDRIREGVKWVSSLDDESKKLIVQIGGIAAALGPATLALGAFAKAISLAMAPIMLKIAALGSLALAITYAVRNYDALKQAIPGLGAVVDQLTKSLTFQWNVLKKIGDAIMRFRSITMGWAESMEEFHEAVPDKGDMAEFESLGEFFKGMFSDMKGFVSDLIGEFFTFEESTSQTADSVEESMGRIRQAMAAPVDEMFEDIPDLRINTAPAEGSIAHLQDRVRALNEFMLETTTQASRDATRELIENYQKQIEAMQGVEEGFEEAGVSGERFGSVAGNALSQAAFYGRDLSNVMDNLLKQFGARTFITGIAALATGGASLGGQSFLSNVFGGIFHSGGRVPGVGDKAIIARGGEHILTPSQMDAMMQPAKVSGSQSMNIRITGNLTGRGDELLAIIDERIRQNGRVL